MQLTVQVREKTTVTTEVNIQLSVTCAGALMEDYVTCTGNDSTECLLCGEITKMQTNRSQTLHSGFACKQK